MNNENDMYIFVHAVSMSMWTVETQILSVPLHLPVNVSLTKSVNVNPP